VVATAIDGYQTVMQDGVQGRLVPPRDSAALSLALLDVLQSPEARQRYGDQGRVTAHSYSWERVAARLLRFYDDVCTGKSGSEWSLARALHAAEADSRMAALALPERAPLLVHLPSAQPSRRLLWHRRQPAMSGHALASHRSRPGPGRFRDQHKANRLLPRRLGRGLQQVQQV
jgi:hypothetical protein